MPADKKASGWPEVFLKWIEAVALRLAPLLVLFALFGCVVLTVRWLRAASPPAGPTVIVLGPDAKGVERKVFAADSLFEYKSKALNPKSEREIADFAAQLRDSHVAQVIVIGHTDRIGGAAYNTRLSQARAEAVREALLRSGLRADRVLAVGIGNRMPATAKDECPGTDKDATTIACLAKDRRVEVWTRTAADPAPPAE